MGGAARNARKKRQAQTASAKAPAAAGAKPAVKRGTVDRRTLVIGAVIAVLLVGVVVGGLIYTNNQKNATEGETIPVARSEASYEVRRDEAVVVVGEDTAKVTLDVYEDFLCPACRAFEDEFGRDIEKHVADGTMRVRYHMLPMLDERSDPAGYSMDSANAGLCAADAGQFPAFHLSLFKAQPEEDARGWDNQQLVQLGKALGMDEATFRSCVDNGEYDSLLRSHFDTVRETPHLQQEVEGQKGFGTPTLAVDEKAVDTSDPKWLEKLVE